MTEKMRAYLDGIFASAPQTDEVKEVKEELYASMVERYNDCLLEGMDDQQAYDTVIESIGDIRELFSELDEPAATAWKEAHEEKSAHEAGQNAAFTLQDALTSISDFASGLINGFVKTGDATAQSQLVNTLTFPLENVTNIDVSYISESITLMASQDNNLVIKEYMNRSDPELFAQATVRGSSISVRNGRRTAVFGLRSYIEVYLPQSWQGSLSLATVSGKVVSEGEWKLASFHGRSISGEIDMHAVEAGMIRLTSTSGTVKIGRGTGTMELHSISGSVKVAEAYGSGSFKTTSGSVRVDFEELTGHVEAGTISGSVRLQLPASANFEFKASSTSGGIYTGFDSCLSFETRHKAHGFVGSAPYYQVKVGTTSGSVHVNM